MWHTTIAGFVRDRQFFLDLIHDKPTDLFAPLPRNPKHTLFRQIRIIGNHNSYHIGGFSILRQVMSTWSKSA